MKKKKNIIHYETVQTATTKSFKLKIKKNYKNTLQFGTTINNETSE